MGLEHFLQVALTKGIGDVAIKRILHFLQTNNLCWADLCTNTDMLNAFFFNKREVVESIASQREAAKHMAEELYKTSVGIMFYNDELFPAKLKQSLGDKCPAFLFYKGNVNIVNKNSVGFCGSRNVSAKGLAITGDCAGQLVKQGIVVVSGYAAGTDLAAHRSALQNSGETIFVLAEGIFKSYIKADVQDLLSGQNHLFVSQFMPGLAWNAGNAMKRNSVIIGLSDSMILIESGRTGGTFAAGNEALSLRHPLFVVDFAQPAVSAEANPYFISKGGIPLRGKNGSPNLAGVFSAVRNSSLGQTEKFA